MANGEAIGLSIVHYPCLFSCCCWVGRVSGGIVAAWLPGPERRHHSVDTDSSR